MDYSNNLEEDGQKTPPTFTLSRDGDEHVLFYIRFDEDDNEDITRLSISEESAYTFIEVFHSYLRDNNDRMLPPIKIPEALMKVPAF